MRFTDRFATLFQQMLPSPFTIAMILTLLTFTLAMVFTSGTGNVNHLTELFGFWEKGLWNNDLLVFALQMMLMLVLGHVLALTAPFNKLISVVVKYCDRTSKAAAIVTFTTILVALFNWGLGLIFGAIFARKVAEYAKHQNKPIHYPLIGAAGYTGLMVWHGGFSGSSLIKVAEPGHLKSMMKGSLTEAQLLLLPDTIAFNETVFSTMNLVTITSLLLLLPLAMYWIGKRCKPTGIQLELYVEEKEQVVGKGAEKLDHSKWFGFLIGGALLVFCLVKMFETTGFINFFVPNNINLLLFALGLMFHCSFKSFLHGIDQAIGGVAGILIQFPLYFGIMGLMNGSGMINQLSHFFVEISTASTYPIFTYISSGIINVFVPSGGGQWAVQGPLIIQASIEMGIPFAKNIMALAYGDQLTNMLQPFWALPLLGITGLKAKQILPYTLLLMLLGGLIYLTMLTIF